MRKGKPTQQRMRMYFSDFFGVRKIAEIGRRRAVSQEGVFLQPNALHYRVFRWNSPTFKENGRSRQIESCHGDSLEKV
jgi:hypothetical protein